jgi:hypothetical protein
MRENTSLATAKHQQDDRRAERDEAEDGMQQEDDGDEQRRPRRIEERQHRGPADEAAHRVQVLQSGAEIGSAGARRGERGIEQVGPRRVVPPAPEPGHGDAAQGVENAEDQDAQSGDHRQVDQRLDPECQQHPVEHLEHVDRRHQDQKVDAAAQQRDQRHAEPRLAKHGLARAARRHRGVGHHDGS